MSEGEKKEEVTTETLPTLRCTHVAGLLKLHQAMDCMQAIFAVREDLAKALQPVFNTLSDVLRNYSVDVKLLEEHAQAKEKEAKDFATGIMELSTALDMEKQLSQSVLERLEHACDQLHEKNVGFAEAIQAKNKQCSEMENERDIYKLRVQTGMEAERDLRTALARAEGQESTLHVRNSELYNRIVELRRYMKKKGLRIPKALQ